MQRLGGLLLIMAGVSLGAYTFLPAPFDSEQALKEVTRISAAPDTLRTASARSAWITSDGTGATTATPPKMDALASQPAARDAIAPTAETSRPSATWSAIVTADASQQARIKSSTPADGETRAQLTVDLQTELRRVGCYTGEINGVWTPSTRRALSAFMERVNATLPMDEPDYILLTLVHGHSAKACGSGCPSGQTETANGQCIPRAVVAARSAKKAKASQDVAMLEPSRPAGERAPAAARANLPVTSDATANVRDAAKNGAVDDLMVAQSSQTERLPWQEDDLSSVPQPRPVRRPDGMMGVGATQMAKADLSIDASDITAAPQRRALSEAPVRRPAKSKTASVFYDENAAYERGLPGTKSGPAVVRSETGADLKPAKRKPQSARKKAIAAPVAAKSAPKAKFFYFAGSGRHGQPRPGSPAFNMLQAMGGVY